MLHKILHCQQRFSLGWLAQSHGLVSDWFRSIVIDPPLHSQDATGSELINSMQNTKTA